MIRDLPLLPSDWDNWDWTLSNGVATAEQTQNAYNAVLNQGECASFSRLVWNDIVNCLVVALEVAGISWDNKYCSAEECKIDIQYGIFTATMFNSVRHNIDRFGIVHWTWSTIETKEGYIGRIDMRGVEQYENMYDTVYGWYLLELTKRLNTLLNVFKDCADFSNLVHISNTNTVNDTRMNRLVMKSIDMFIYSIFIGVSISAAIPSIPIYGAELIGVPYNAVANTIAVKALINSSYSTFKDLCVGACVPSEPLISNVISQILFSVNVESSHTALMNHNSLLRVKYELLSSKIKANPIRHSGKVLTNDHAVLNNVSDIQYLDYNSPTSINTLANIARVMRKYISATNTMYSTTGAELSAEMISVVKYIDKTQSLTAATMNKHQSTLIESAVKVASAGLAKAISTSPKCLFYAGNINDISTVEIRNVQSKTISAQIDDEVYELAKIAKCESLTLEAAARIQSYISSELAVISSKVLRAIVNEGISIEAKLSIDTSGVWKDPIHTDKDLYIRSAHPQWQEGNTVHLDGGGVFYDAEKTGTNVYIRSVDSMNGV